MSKTEKAPVIGAQNQIFNKKSGASKTLFSIKGIPETLQKIPSWCLWGFREINGKPTKVPLNKLHRMTDGTNPSYGYPFSDVCKHVQKTEGLGFILSNNVVCVDIDKCIIEGKFNELANTLLNEIPTYTEYSQSGTGLHLFYLDKDHQFTNRKNTFELFSARKYVSVTGFHIDDLPIDLSTLDGKTIELLTKYFPITTTSANITGENTPDNVNDIKQSLDNNISVYIRSQNNTTHCDITNCHKVSKNSVLFKDIGFKFVSDWIFSDWIPC